MRSPDSAWAAYQHFISEGDVDSAMSVVWMFQLDPGGSASDGFVPDENTKAIIEAVRHVNGVRNMVNHAYITRRVEAANIAVDSGALLDVVERAMRLIEGRRAAV